MLFMICFVSYMLRVNISINIIAMVKNKPSSNSSLLTNETTLYNDSKNDDLPDVRDYAINLNYIPLILFEIPHKFKFNFQMKVWTPILLEQA